MPDLARAFRRFFGNLERVTGDSHRAFCRLIRLRPPMQIVHYMGYAGGRDAFLKGRVQRMKLLSPPGKEDTRSRNFFMMLRRYFTDERPGAEVRARLAGEELTLITDHEGYFDAHFQLKTPLNPRMRWHTVDLKLISPLGRHQKVVRAEAAVQLPPTDATFGIISDIDDTVIHTGATNFIRMVGVVMFGNAKTRLAFKGVAAFYKALKAGASGKGENPIFYVTSSPWNIYDVICEVFRVHGIPAGPLFMKEYGFDETKFIKSSHGSHKLGAIRQILMLYPNLPFILVGDSGQKDPEIYRQIVHEYPDRIRAIYIRNVTKNPSRDDAVRALGREISSHTGTALILSRDTLEAARHAAEAGLISPNSLKLIREDMEADKEEPSLAEKMLNQQT